MHLNTSAPGRTTDAVSSVLRSTREPERWEAAGGSASRLSTVHTGSAIRQRGSVIVGRISFSVSFLGRL